MYVCERFFGFGSQERLRLKPGVQPTLCRGCARQIIPIIMRLPHCAWYKVSLIRCNQQNDRGLQLGLTELVDHICVTHANLNSLGEAAISKGTFHP